MHEKVKAYLDSRKKVEREKYEAVKSSTLLELDLYEKVYSEFDRYSREYPDVEWDKASHKDRYFKKVPIAVTDEEYKEILKYSKKEDSLDTNPIAIALTVIAYIIFIGGFIAGIALGNQDVVKGTYYQYTVTEFSFAIAFTYWCIAFISGTMFLGFAEIIKLLHAIKNKKN